MSRRCKAPGRVPTSRQYTPIPVLAEVAKSRIAPRRPALLRPLDGHRPDADEHMFHSSYRRPRESVARRPALVERMLEQEIGRAGGSGWASACTRCSGRGTPPPDLPISRSPCSIHLCQPAVIVVTPCAARNKPRIRSGGSASAPPPRCLPSSRRWRCTSRRQARGARRHSGLLGNGPSWPSKS